MFRRTALALGFALGALAGRLAPPVQSAPSSPPATKKEGRARAARAPWGWWGRSSSSKRTPPGGGAREVERRRRQIERGLLMTTVEEEGYKLFLREARGAERLCLGYDPGGGDEQSAVVVLTKNTSIGKSELVVRCGRQPGRATARALVVDAGIAR